MATNQRKKRDRIPPELSIGASAAATGALLGGGIPLLKRRVAATTALKGGLKGAGIAAAIGAGSTLIGRKVAGDPKPGETHPFTKRAAIGGAIGGALAGGAGGLILSKSAGGRKLLGKLARTWRPANWAKKGGAKAAVGIGALAGSLVASSQGADEGQQVDTIRAIRARKLRTHTFGVEFLAARLREQLFDYGDEPVLKGKLAADKYKKRIRDEDLDRRDARIAHAILAGGLAGALAKHKTAPLLARAAVGAGAATAGVLGVRAATSHTRDLYGERSRGAKKTEKIPAAAALAAAAVLARRRVKSRYGFTRGTARGITEFRVLKNTRDDGADLRSQRLRLATYAGGALLAAGGLAVLAKRPAGGAVMKAASAIKPAGRGTLERIAKAAAMKRERGYVYLKPPSTPGAQKRLANLPTSVQAKVARYSGLGTNPNLSPEEKRKFRIAVGEIRAEHRFSLTSDLRHLTSFSSFIKDIAFKDLPAETRKNIRAFHPQIKAKTKLSHYGMVPKELAAKADPHNLASARKNVGARSARACAAEVYKRRGEKFIIVNNDQIQDGHHFLAKAERGKVSGSLHVIDLTPARFQLNMEAKLDYVRQVLLESKLRKAVEFMYSGEMPMPDAKPVRAGRADGKKKKGARRKLSKKLRKYLKIPFSAFARPLTSDLRPLTFFRREQLREKDSDRWADPRLVAIGEQAAYAHTPSGTKRSYGPGGGDLSVAHAQVLRKVYGDAGRIRKTVGRTHALLRDAADVVAGRPRRADASGRPQKREWEKSWFRRTAADVAIGAAGVGGLLALKKNPVLRSRVMTAAGRVKRRVNKAVPDFFAGRKLPVTATEFAALPSRFNGKIDYREQEHLYELARSLRKFLRGGKANPIRSRVPVKTPSNVIDLAAKLRERVQLSHDMVGYVIDGVFHEFDFRPCATHFDDLAGLAGWDVRDPRGRSARVFAPGSRRRVRREKEWHEKVDNQRKLLAALALATGVGAGVGGYVLGRRNPLRPRPAVSSNIIRMPRAG